MPDTCISCRQSKASLKNMTRCGVCQGQLCKDCAHFLDPSAFSFLKAVPDELVHPFYCGSCHERKVVPALESYEEVMERARRVEVFFKNERNLPPHRRSNKALSVQHCEDRKETLLRLAFFAAEKAFTALVSVDIHSKKILISGYQKTDWSGTGFPANLFVAKL